jgi:photosystem II stability/assembly factor-like uncharacterized protein
VFQSLDGGDTWTAASTGLGSLDVRGLAAHPTAAGTLYAATRSGMFRSIDGGASWTGINNNLNDPVLNCVVVDPVTPTTLYAGTVNDGVYRSTNDGQSWQRRTTGLLADNIVRLAITPASPERLYAVSPGDVADDRNAGVYISDNRGDNWTQLNTGLRPEASTAVVVDPATSSAFVGTRGGGVFRR